MSLMKVSIFSFIIIMLFSINALCAPYGAKWYDVSEYLLGKVYIKVFFLESNEKSPNTENWTKEEKTHCKDALEKALGEIRKRFVREFEVEPGTGKLPPGVNLSFVTDYETAEVSVEPIQLNGSGVFFSTGDLKLWVNEVMAKKGFTKKTPPPGKHPILPYPPYQYNVADYAHHLRNTHGTDWATVIFFYDNSNDEDGLFANKRSAGPPMGLGGPGLHFSNQRRHQFSKIKGLIHEFLHVWYAIDEHTMNKHFRKDAVIGYLGGKNLNFGKAMGYKSVMYYAQDWPEMSPYTIKQIGWTDSDGDHIPDILDVRPKVSLFSSPQNNSLTFKGKAISPALPNRNPYSKGGTIKPPYDLSVVLHLAPEPEKRLGILKGFKKVPAFKPPFPWTKNDITINKIISVEYRMLKNEKPFTDWMQATPDDGAFDYAEEDFTFSVNPPDSGEYIIEVRSKNSVHLYSDVERIRVH